MKVEVDLANCGWQRVIPSGCFYAPPIDGFKQVTCNKRFRDGSFQ